jgi:UDP-2-acetamido-3-amino-2,3-dideoxy-glucuronate N-acetyltransferase
MSEYFKHETAIVDDGARIGKGTKIWHFSHVCGNNTTVGRDCVLGQNVYVAPNVSIGDGCRIQNNVSVYDMVKLEDYVFCGPSVVFTNVINPRAHISRKNEFKKTLVRKGATLGANCTIVCGVEIGQFAFIAAGAVVNKNVPQFALMAGVPAKQIGWMCQCGVKLPANGKCAACNSEYEIKGDYCAPIKFTGMVF